MKKILLVDDDPFISDLVETKLAQEGFAISRLADGNHVIPTLETEIPNLLLLDLDLPHKDGFTILEEMRKTEKFATIPVVILSNDDGPEVEEKARFLSASFYMKALTDMDELLEIVNKTVS